MSDPVVITFVKHTAAAPAAAWRVLSDTDRFNRVAGFGFSWDERPGADGVARTGRVRRFGLELVWDEEPWEFRAPEGFVVTRRFHGGPASHLQTELRLVPRADGGTTVRYEVRLYPRHLLAKPVLALDARMTTSPQLDATLDKALAALAGDASYDAPPALTGAAAALVERVTASLEPRLLAEGLRDVLLHAPLVDQDALRPLALAARWGVSEAAAIEGFLAAVKSGLLTMSFQLLCPSCNGAKQRLDALAVVGEVHCGSCDLTFDGAFPDGVEVVFRPAPVVRTFEVHTDCAVSPARTPHVVAQTKLPAGGTWEGALTLPTGAWRVAVGQDSALLEVVEGGDADVTVVIEADGLFPGVSRVAPGGTLHVVNRRAARVTIALKRPWRPENALTAGRLLAAEGARALLPNNALSAGLTVEAGRRGVLAVASQDATDEVRKKLSRGAVREHVGNGVLITTWDDATWALAAAEALSGDPRLRCGVAVGTVVELGGVPSGPAVDEALTALRTAGAGRVLTTEVALREVDFAAALATLAERVAVTHTPAGALLTFPAAEQRRERGPVDRRKSGDSAESFAGLYRLARLLGEGGFGQVWDAVEVASGRRLAVKVLRPELACDAAVAQRFYNEARIVTRLKSPHTVRVFDYGTGGARLYMAMERLTGTELTNLIGAGRLAPDRVRRIGAGVLASLVDAHAAGVIHRDLKPDNVFVLDGDHAKVIDFGVAHHPQGAMGDKTGFVLGTPLYMAPEQLEGHVDPRSDLYSLGLVLYQALSGRLPWEGAPRAVVVMRLEEPPAPLSEVAPETPRALADVVMRALEREPDARWRDASAMASALAL